MEDTNRFPDATSRGAAGAARSHGPRGRPRLGRALLAVLPALVWMAGPFLGAALPSGLGAAAAAEGNPLIVGGFQVGERMQGILNEIQVALDGVTDAATAEEAVKSFSDAEREILELEPFLLLLPHEGKTAIAAQVMGAMIIMKPTAEKLMADGTIGPVLKPGFDKLVDKFKSLGS